jgi:hypothetical protein
MDGTTSRSHGTGRGHGGSWLDAGLNDVEFSAQDQGSIASNNVRGGAGAMGRSTTARFRRQTANGHFCSRSDVEEGANRDISFASDTSSFTRSAMSKSMFGTSAGMGFGGNPTNTRFRARTASGHYLSKADQEAAANRDLSNASTDLSSRSSFRAASKTVGASTRPGMGMGGSSSRFRATTRSGHYVSKADAQEALMRDHSSAGFGVSSTTSSFASAMKKGNPRYSVMGGTTSRFAGTGSMYKKTSLSSDVGPGSYSKPTTAYDKLPMPAMVAQP